MWESKQSLYYLKHVLQSAAHWRPLLVPGVTGAIPAGAKRPWAGGETPAARTARPAPCPLHGPETFNPFGRAGANHNFSPLSSSLTEPPSSQRGDDLDPVTSCTVRRQGNRARCSEHRHTPPDTAPPPRLPGQERGESSAPSPEKTVPKPFSLALLLPPTWPSRTPPQGPVSCPSEDGTAQHSLQHMKHWGTRSPSSGPGTWGILPSTEPPLTYSPPGCPKDHP